MRGPLVSRPIGDVLQEAKNLAEAGVRELLVISQDTSAYGVDLKYRMGFWGGRPVKTRLKELCEALAEFGIWVRLHYVYPYPSVDELIPLMAEGKLLPYLDVPFQHASPRVLKAMKRPASAENNLERIKAWRAICPEITIRSTFIAGFPGETEAEFEELLGFLEEAKLDRVGCFAYSPVEGASAKCLGRRGAGGGARRTSAPADGRCRKTFPPNCWPPRSGARSRSSSTRSMRKGRLPVRRPMHRRSTVWSSSTVSSMPSPAISCACAWSMPMSTIFTPRLPDRDS